MGVILTQSQRGKHAILEDCYEGLIWVGVVLGRWLRWGERCGRMMRMCGLGGLPRVFGEGWGYGQRGQWI